MSVDGFRISRASDLRREFYIRIFKDEDGIDHIVGMVKMIDVPEAALIYIDRGRRLFLVGRRDTGGLVIYCWDPHMPSHIRHLIDDDCLVPLAGSFYPIHINNVACVGINSIYSVQQRSVNRLLFISPSVEIQRNWQAIGIH